MNYNKILTINIFSSILLLSACSNSQDQLKKEPLSVYNIMGITEANKDYIEQEEEFTSDITYISYRDLENKRVSESDNSITSDITYISYRDSTDTYSPNLLTLQKIKSGAKSFLGTPYVWGATGPNKFDCSGFTQWVYRDVGINIPRVSRDQARVGEFISYNNLKAGDMVFFDTHKKRTGRVSHVGIYLGSGNFIHASSAGKAVVIYNFNEKPFYKKRFLWGRRVLSPNIRYALN